jgi:hypothetical protein
VVADNFLRPAIRERIIGEGGNLAAKQHCVGTSVGAYI